MRTNLSAYSYTHYTILQYFPHYISVRYCLKERGVFETVSGVLAGKPMDETYAQEYRQLLIQVINKPDLPVVFNLNIGHAMPRCIIPFGIESVVDVEGQIIKFTD